MNANNGWNHPRMSRDEFEAKSKRMRAEELARVERMREDQAERHAKAARWGVLRDAELRAIAAVKAVKA